MANPNKVMGQCRIKANGKIFETEGKSTIQPGGVKRDAVQADYRSGMFTEQALDSKVSCNILITAGVSVAELQGIDDATITFEADTGQTWVINHAYTSNEVSASDGKAPVEFAGPAAEELSA